MALTFAAEEVQASGLGSDMGVLLRTLFDQEQKYCDKDEGGCGTPYVGGWAGLAAGGAVGWGACRANLAQRCSS